MLKFEQNKIFYFFNNKFSISFLILIICFTFFRIEKIKLKVQFGQFTYNKRYKCSQKLKIKKLKNLSKPIKFYQIGMKIRNQRINKSKNTTPINFR